MLASRLILRRQEEPPKRSPHRDVDQKRKRSIVSADAQFAIQFAATHLPGNL